MYEVQHQQANPAKSTRVKMGKKISSRPSSRKSSEPYCDNIVADPSHEFLKSRPKHFDSMVTTQKSRSRKAEKSTDVAQCVPSQSKRPPAGAPTSRPVRTATARATHSGTNSQHRPAILSQPSIGSLSVQSQTQAKLSQSRVSSSSDQPVDKAQRRNTAPVIDSSMYTYSQEIAQIMYNYGEVDNLSDEASALVEDIARQHVLVMVRVQCLNKQNMTKCTFQMTCTNPTSELDQLNKIK